MEEVWKPCYGLEDKLLIRSDKKSVIILNYNRTKKNVEKECKITKDGHLCIDIGYKGKKITVKLHRAIYETYKQCTIPNGYDVHHIDFNPFNNSIDNLVLLTHSKHRTLHNNINNPNKPKPVVQLTKDEQFVAEYPSTMEAQRQTGINNSLISKCCNGIYKQTNGFIFKYKEVA